MLSKLDTPDFRNLMSVTSPELDWDRAIRNKRIVYMFMGSMIVGTYAAFVEFAMAVFAHLVQRGAKLALTPEVRVEPGLLALECFPNAAWRKLGISPLPAKAQCKRVDISNRLKEPTGRFGVDIPYNSPTHDELQALVSAFAGKASRIVIVPTEYHPL